MLTCLYNSSIIFIDNYINDLPLRELGREGKLLCPDPNCRHPVILHQGKFKRPHFAHRTGIGDSCHFGQGESEEHDYGKRYIYSLLKSLFSPEQVRPECFLESGQKADVLLDLGNEKFAFEIQFSEQDGKTWESRSERYRDIGVIPIWILGYRKRLDVICKPQGAHQLLRFELGRTREYAVGKVGLCQELIDQLKGQKSWTQDPWDNVDQYQVVHILCISGGISEFHLGYVTQKSATIWEGYTLPITPTSIFDLSQARWIPEIETSAIQSAKIKLQERTRWSNRIDAIQGELRKKVLAYTNVENLQWLPLVLANEDIFFGEGHNGPYDILLLEVALYLKIIRLNIFYEDTIEDIFRCWNFEWKEYRDLFIRGELGKFFERLVKKGILLNTDGWKWQVLGRLTEQVQYDK